MRRISLTAFILVAFSAAYCAEQGEKSEEESSEQSQKYTCPMHPEVVQDAPGTCPICKMDLVPMKTGRAAVEKGKKDRSNEEPQGSESGSGKDVVIDPVVVQSMGVRIAEAERTSIYRHVRTVGEVLVAEDELSVVNLRFTGWIEKIFVDETGQKVKKGQRLFSVYSPEVVQALEEYLIAARREGASSRLAKAAARRLELWEVPVFYLKQTLKDGKAPRTITIHSPISGYVLHKNVVKGAHVKEGTDLYRIGDLNRIWVNAEVYEFDAPWVSAGQDATMELSFQQGKTWKGKVAYVYPTLNPRTRTLTIRLEFENPGLGLKPGMLAIVRIEAQHRDDAIAVPTEAVIHSGERRLVFVSLGDGRYEPREVVTGLVGDNRKTEIIEGLDAGEKVVVSGQFLLDSESQLQEAVQKLMDSRLEGHEGHDHGGRKREKKQKTYWTCPMHPEVVQDGPGTCPICGMDLVEKKK